MLDEKEQVSMEILEWINENIVWGNYLYDKNKGLAGTALPYYNKAYTPYKTA